MTGAEFGPGPLVGGISRRGLLGGAAPLPPRDIGIEQARPSTSVAKRAVMKVIGLGSPDDLRVRFDPSEVDVLFDVLRDLPAKATRDAAETYATTPPRETRPIDDRHDRLRGLEGLLMQREEQPARQPARGDPRRRHDARARRRARAGRAQLALGDPALMRRLQHYEHSPANAARD